MATSRCAGQPECRGMDGAGFAVERLRRRQRIKRTHDVVRPERSPRPAPCAAPAWPPPAIRSRTGRSRSVRQGAVAARRIRCAARLGEPHAQLDAEFLLDDIQPLDFVDRRHDAFGQAEAERKVFEILRRRHHHGVGAAVIGERDRRLLRDRALAGSAAVPLPGDALHPFERRRHAFTPRLPEARYGGSRARTPRIPPASATARSTAKSAPPSPCIPGNWSPSRR